MNGSHHARRRFGACLWTGLGLADFALFLHPMSPENFLALAFSDPLQSVGRQYGSETAIFFWASLSLAAVGLLGLLAATGRYFRNV